MYVALPLRYCYATGRTAAQAAIREATPPGSTENERKLVFHNFQIAGRASYMDVPLSTAGQPFRTACEAHQEIFCCRRCAVASPTASAHSSAMGRVKARRGKPIGTWISLERQSTVCAGGAYPGVTGSLPKNGNYKIRARSLCPEQATGRRAAKAHSPAMWADACADARGGQSCQQRHHHQHWHRSTFRRELDDGRSPPRLLAAKHQRQ